MGAIKDQFYYTKQGDDKLIEVIDAQITALAAKVTALETENKELKRRLDGLKA